MSRVSKIAVAVTFAWVVTGSQLRGQSVDLSLWETYDDGGWVQLFEKRDTAKAGQYFEKAQAILAGQSAADAITDAGKLHRGRTMAGRAWVEYRTIAKKVNDSVKANDGKNVSIDSTPLYREAQNKAKQAVDLLAKTLPRQDIKFRAYALQVLALTSIELCDGSAAEKHLKDANDIYKDIEDKERYFDTLHVMAKLRQCRRDLVGAVQLYSQILQEATTPARRLAALLDLANTLSWLGEYRTAWQLRSQWQQLENQLKKQLEDQLPEQKPSDLQMRAELMFRGRLVFARIGILYGDFKASEQLLEEANVACTKEDISPICQAVYWILVGELALARGDLKKIEEAQTHVEIYGELPPSGYACIEVVAVDAACRQAVIECCTYEMICVDACCRRPAYRVLFTEQTQKLEPVDVKKLFGLIWDRMLGEEQLSQGDFRSAAETLQRVRTETDKVLPPGSPVTIGPMIAQAKALQLQKLDSTEIKNLLVAALGIVEKIKASEHSVRSDLLEILGNWRMQLSEYDLAAELYQGAMKHGQFVRSSNHPQQGVLRMKLIEANAAAGDLKDALKTLAEVRALFEKAELNCYDYRLAEVKSLAAWICFLQGNNAVQANREFAEANAFWVKREEELAVDDTRRASTVLGQVASMVEMGIPETNQDLMKTFDQYRRLAILQCTQSMVAHELNRVGFVLKRSGKLRAANYLYGKSADLYKSQGFSENEAKVRSNIEKLDKPPAK